VGFAATWRAEGARLDDPRWQRNWTIALVVSLAVQIGRGVLGEPWLASVLVWSGLLQLARLANRRSAREYLQIALLAFLHLCAATVLSTEITYGLAFLGFVVVTPWMLALTQLRAEIESQHLVRLREAQNAETQTADDDRITLPPGATSGVTQAQLARLLSSRRLVGGPFLVGTALLSLPLFALTAMLFIAFPRVGLGMLAFGGQSGTNVAGFGNEVELGQVGRIRDDATVVLRVTPPNLGDSDPPQLLDLYLRGTSFDHYDGRRWTRTGREGGRHLPQLLNEYTITRSFNPQTDVPYGIVLDALDQTVVFLPQHTVAIQVPPHIVSGIERARHITLQPGLDVRYEEDETRGLRYTAWLSAVPEHEVSPPLSTEELTRYLQVPEDHERLAELAREWTRDARTDRERAERMVQHLHAPPFVYSLDMRDPGDRPPLERFLFEWRTGHCEYYASAMVVLLRTVGVPSRNVTGFLGGRWNGYGRYYAVRSGDAHAWVEAYLPGEGWVQFDPTPPGRNDLSVVASVLEGLRNVIDAAIVWWELDIVSFDLRSQRDILTESWRWFRGRRTSGELAAEEEHTPDAPSRAPWVVLVAVFVLGFVAWRLRGRHRAPEEASVSERVARVIALYRTLEAALAARGAPRPSSHTPREHAATLVARGFRGAETVVAVTDRYNEARFGTTTVGDAEMQALESRVAALHRGPE
jgi:transglutaminase-like putative cysteine protease